MPDLVKCEFWKMKRKRLIYALMSLSLFFPLILAYMAKAGTGTDTTEHYLQTRFDYVYTMMLGYGLVFLLPCLIGIIAAILFFIERDCVVLCQEKVQLKNDLFSSFFTTRLSTVIMFMN